MKAILVVSLMLMFLDALSQTELKRQPEWGAIFISGHPNSPGMIVRRLQPGSILEKSGVREHDLVIGIGNVRLSDPYISGKTLRSFRAGDEVTLSVLRNGKISEHLGYTSGKAVRELQKYSGNLWFGGYRKR